MAVLDVNYVRKTGSGKSQRKLCCSWDDIFLCLSSFMSSALIESDIYNAFEVDVHVEEMLEDTEWMQPTSVFSQLQTQTTVLFLTHTDRSMQLYKELYWVKLCKPTYCWIITVGAILHDWPTVSQKWPHDTNLEQRSCASLAVNEI